MKHSLLFFGTPDFAVPFLDTLMQRSDCEIRGVFTQPDKPAGRSQQVTPSPVKVAALAQQLPVHTPASLTQPEGQREAAAYHADCFVVVAYGKLLPAAALSLPPKGCINVHFSLLPRYRGASPIEQAILDDARETGVTIMLLDEGMDTGPILAQAVVPIATDDTKRSLRTKLVASGRALLEQVLPAWLDGSITPVPQDISRATVTHRIDKEHGRIIWKTQSAAQIARMIRAYDGWPGVYTMWDTARIKVLRAQAMPSSNSTPPGTVLRTETGIGIATTDGTLILHSIQREGGTAVDPETFLRGHPTFLGAVLT